MTEGGNDVFRFLNLAIYKTSEVKQLLRIHVLLTKMPSSLNYFDMDAHFSIELLCLENYLLLVTQ